MPHPISYTSYRTSKKKLLKKLKPFARREFSMYINAIVADTRNIPLSDANQIKYLRSDEVVKMLEKIGEPLEPFGKPVTIGSSRLTRFDLSIKVPYLSGLVLRRNIIRIMMESRGLGFKDVRSKKILHSNEVMEFLRSIGEPVTQPAR
ncbi:hypothetical protein [Flagellimonas marina]|uniref:Uncharacterized protein n=1 Tax=Flagellimonas marina TaxID=1775168 RepID=A0ABV8PJH2_9FLAO